MKIKQILKYVGNENCICILILTDKNEYYILAEKTNTFSINCEADRDYIDDIYLFTRNKKYNLSIDLEKREQTNSFYHLIKIENPDFFNDAVKIIQIFI